MYSFKLGRREHTCDVELSKTVGQVKAEVLAAFGDVSISDYSRLWFTFDGNVLQDENTMSESGFWGYLCLCQAAHRHKIYQPDHHKFWPDDLTPTVWILTEAPREFPLESLKKEKYGMEHQQAFKMMNLRPFSIPASTIMPYYQVFDRLSNMIYRVAGFEARFYTRHLVWKDMALLGIFTDVDVDHHLLPLHAIGPGIDEDDFTFVTEPQERCMMGGGGSDANVISVYDKVTHQRESVNLTSMKSTMTIKEFKELVSNMLSISSSERKWMWASNSLKGETACMASDRVGYAELVNDDHWVVDVLGSGSLRLDRISSGSSSRRRRPKPGQQSGSSSRVPGR